MAQIKARDEGTARWIEIRDGNITSGAGMHAKPDITLSFKNVAIAKGAPTAETAARFRPAGLDFSTYKPKHFLWTVEGKVATITLNRPERKNPLTFESYAELRDLFRELVYAERRQGRRDHRRGRQFLLRRRRARDHRPAGAMQEWTTWPGLLAFTRMTGDLVKAMRACPQPIVAAVDGICAGAGAILAMASDLRVGTRAQQGRLPVRAGRARRRRHGRLHASCRASSARPRRRAALHRPRDGRRRGRALGLLQPARAQPDDVLEEAQALAAGLADGPTFAHAMTKKCLHQEWNMRSTRRSRPRRRRRRSACRPRTSSRAYRGLRRQAEAGVRRQLIRIET